MNMTCCDNVGYYLDWYNGDKKIINCKSCGKLIKKYNSRKYCKVCAREIHKEVKRASWHKNKEKYKSTRQIENPL